MKRFLLLCIAFIVFLTAPILHAAEAAEPSGQVTIRQEVFILNSYHPGYAWSDDVQAAIIDLFRAKDKNWLPVIEYLDLKRLPDGRHLAKLKQLFRSKYQNKKFSVVIAMDNPALEFAINNQAELFRNAPIVFCGINNYKPSLLKGHPDVTGIAESLDIAGTIEVMLRLHPATREIFIPHDYTVSVLAVRKEIEALGPRFGAKVRFRFTDPLTMEELLKELERLPMDSLVLEIGFIIDKSGRTFGMTEAVRLFFEHSPVPVYSTYEQRLGFGIVGGKLLSARIHGTNAARIALRVLAGEKASAIPVVLESDSQFMFDYKVMSRFGIPLSALPEGSTVINKPVSIYAAHRVFIQAVSGIIGILIIVISLLTVIISQRRRSTIALRASEAKYYDLYENAPDMFLSVDTKTATITECNSTLVNSLGYAKEDIVGRSVFEMYHPDCREDAKRVFQQFAATGEVRDTELTISRKDGGIIDISVNISAVRDKEGKVTRSRSVWRDITERKRAEVALRESEGRLRTIIEASLDAIIAVNVEGRLVLFNGAAQELFQYSEEEALNQPVGILLREERGKIHQERLERFLNSGIGQCGHIGRRMEKVFRRKDGSLFEAEVSMSGGRLNGLRFVILAIHDITARRQAEEMLRESEQRYCLLATYHKRINNISISFTEASGTEDLFNRIAESFRLLTGAIAATFSVYNQETRDLKAVSLSIDPISRGKVDSIFGPELFEMRMPVSVDDMEHMLSHGIRRPKDLCELSFRVIPQDISDAVMDAVGCRQIVALAIRYAEELVGTCVAYLPGDQPVVPDDALNTYIYLSGLAVKRRQAEEALRESEEKYRLIAENTADLISILDMNLQFTYVSPASMRLRGFTVEEAMKQTLEQVLTPESMRLALTVFEKEMQLDASGTADPGRTRILELEGYKKDGSIIWVEVNLSFLHDKDRKLVEILTVSRDITESKLAEAALIVANKELVFQNEEKEKRAAELVIANKELVFQNEEKEKREVVLEKMLIERKQAEEDMHRLYGDAQRRAEHLEALRDIDHAVLNSLDIALTIPLILTHVQARLNVDATAILLLNPISQTLTFAAGRGFRTKVLEKTRLRLGEGYAGRAALERQIVNIPKLPTASDAFSRAPLLEGEEFATYYAAPLIAKGLVKGVLEIFHRAPFTPDDEWLAFFKILADQTAIAIDSALLVTDLQRSNVDLSLAYDATIEGWAKALDLRDKETEGHSRRVTEMTERIAQAMDFSEANLVHTRRGALLHDLGKLGIPDSILLKPGPLTDEELVIMRRHPQLAFDLLSPIAYLRPALDIPYCHHEKFDGTGYPRGLKGEQIPQVARIFAVVDVWDALRADRPYRAAMPPDEARAIIEANTGRHFDAQVVEAFFKVILTE